jgi:tetratricopeptide (TPR) repeat protein
MKIIFLIASTIPISLSIFPLRSLAIVSRSREYPPVMNRFHIAQVENSAQAYFEQGNAKYSLGDNQGAIINYDRAIATDPKYVNAYYNRGNAKSALEKEQEAIIDFNSAIALSPRFTDAYFYRDLAKSILKKNEEAIIDYGFISRSYKIIK